MINERKHYIDLLRSVAILSIIMLHVSTSKFPVTDVHTFEWQIMNIFSAICRAGLPLFMMITGVLFLCREKPTDYLIIFKKNIYKSVMAILIFGTLIFISISLPDFLMFDEHSVENFLKRFWEACNWYHLWYMYMIIGIYLLIPVFQYVTKTISKSQLEILILILFFFTICVPCFKEFIPELSRLFPHKLTFPINSEWVLYLFLGHYFDKYTLNKKAKQLLYGLGFLGLFVIILGTYYMSVNQESLYVYFFSSKSPARLFYTLSVFVFIKYSCNKLVKSSNMSSYVQKLAILSFTMYGIHDIFIVLSRRLLHLTVSSFHPILSIPLLFIIVSLFSNLFAWLINKIPFVKKILT